ncbi:hypothetical protein LJB85_02365 [Porphyromonadaceae bacterium OttesenSCG-928-L07]|nr:hypothetical protein [Porphyromonadaceae bacterium OttesenSCG-928-L07]
MRPTDQFRQDFEYQKNDYKRSVKQNLNSLMSNLKSSLDISLNKQLLSAKILACKTVSI